MCIRDRLKKYLPELKGKKQLVEALNAHSFETKDAGGRTVDVDVPSNRYADAASHIGIAQEAKAVLGLKKSAIPEMFHGRIGAFGKGGVNVSVEDVGLCSRYIARSFENVKVEESPKWIRGVLEECGLRPINNIVDVTNYAMLETGQPLHAFDAAKVEGGIIVRKAANGEKIKTIEGKTYTLNPDILIIADKRGPLAIAGIKGGERAAVSRKTSEIILEAADFDSQSIYKASKALGLVTDASLRFSHNMHPVLAEGGMRRASELIEKIGAASPGKATDTAPQKPYRRKITFDIDRFRRLTGLSIKKSEALRYLKRLGFSADGNKVSVPPLRTDVETDADLAEDIVRLVGYGEVPSEAPVVKVGEHIIDEHFALADFVRNALTSFGFDEVYSDSFWRDGEVEVANPIAEDKKYLRKSLAPLLIKNVSGNLRFYDAVLLFEIGKVFSKSGEHYSLGIGGGAKKKEMFFVVKGAVDGLLRALGLTDFVMYELESGREGVMVKSDSKILGSIVREKDVSYAEIDMDKLLEVVEWEKMYRPIPKHPAVERDISLMLGAEARIGDVMKSIEESNLDIIEDVDLIDEYLDERGARQSITLRIVFRADNRTLSAEEVDAEMRRIISLLERKFKARVK